MAAKTRKKSSSKATRGASARKKATPRRSARKAPAKAADKGPTAYSRLKPLVDDIPSTEFDKIFEQKLADQYRIFRNLKEHHLQTRKFMRILVILLIIILIAILLISFSGV